MSGTIDTIMNKYGTNTVKVDKSSQSGSDLNMDMFLNLLVTQMQYQDPLEPTKNEDFLAQMAQYSSLEQMQNMGRSFQMNQANQMIGKVVQANVKNETSGDVEYVEGFVDSVAYRDGDIYLVVGEKELSLEDVLNVTTVDYDTRSAITMEGISKTLAEINEKLENLTGETDHTEETGETESKERESGVDES